MKLFSEQLETEQGTVFARMIRSAEDTAGVSRNYLAFLDAAVPPRGQSVM